MIGHNLDECIDDSTMRIRRREEREKFALDYPLPTAAVLYETNPIPTQHPIPNRHRVTALTHDINVRMR